MGVLIGFCFVSAFCVYCVKNRVFVDSVVISKCLFFFADVYVEDFLVFICYPLLTLRRLMSYIYDISSLKVNNLTLILLTWRKW